MASEVFGDVHASAGDNEPLTAAVSVLERDYKLHFTGDAVGIKEVPQEIEQRTGKVVQELFGCVLVAVFCGC
jgi:hypothetical protein